MEYYINVEKDVKIFVEDINSKCEKTIMFVHGWPLNHNMYEYIVAYFISRGYRCVTIDLRGYGKSDKPCSGYDYDRMSTDIRYVIETLRLKNITLMGHSMGGAICSRYMSKFKGYGVARLCLLSAAAPKWVQSSDWPYGYTVDEVNSIIENFKNDRPKSIINTSESFFYKFTSQGILNWFFYMCLNAAGWSTVNSLYALRDENVFNDLASIKTPTLILHGIYDSVCPFEFAEYMNKTIEESKLVPLANGGHGAFYECRNDINSELEKFIINN
ncbi:alpha/beta fold hydrolase [Terrisporobacter petrolearius]|uniref:alpha/beta fold hydrolase n=1 Tax=Terrisporobacter petrolearius TaxID=1460447 RepID=UPI003B003F74